MTEILTDNWHLYPPIQTLFIHFIFNSDAWLINAPTLVPTRTKGVDDEKFLVKLIFEGLLPMEIKVVYTGWWIFLFMEHVRVASFPHHCVARKTEQNKPTRVSFIFSKT